VNGLKKSIENLKKIGECLKGGELIESPFEDPVEEERHKDADQSDDDRNYDDENVCIPIESPENKKKEIDPEKSKYIFRYFLDGSLRTKFLGEFIEGTLSFPILTSEICVAIIKRDGKKLLPLSKNKKLFFIFPHKNSNLISDDIYEKLEKLRENLQESDPFLRIEFLKKEAIRGDLRYSMCGKARSLMHDMEHESAKDIKRESDEWLIMDGAIRNSEFLHLPNTIGVAKSFSRKPLFQLDKNVIPLAAPAYLKHIRKGERSLLFKKKTSRDTTLKKVAFWFVRLRKSPPQMEPLGGLVKIDFHCEKGQLDENDIELIDTISAEIYDMRLPSVYPWPRWPNYIYPIRLAEEFMGSIFIDKEYLSYMGRVIKNAIRA
jgi:hypothetical protein